MAEQKNGSSARQVNPTMFMALVSNSTDGIVCTDGTGNIMYANQSLADMHGYDNPEELVDSNMMQLVDEGDRHRLQTEMIPYMERQGYWSDLIIKHCRKDGSKLHVSSAGFLLRDESGNTVGVGITIHDVTEQMEQRRFLQQVFDAVPSIMMVKDQDGIFKMVNERAAKTYGTTPEDMIGKSDYDYSNTPEQIEAYNAKDREALENKIAVHIPEETITHVTGEVRYYQTTKVPLVDDDGAAKHILVVATDIHDRRIAEMENDRLREEMLHAQQQALKELSTPIIPVFNGVLVMPLIGSIDSARAQDIMRNLLRGITEHRARTVIVDITGVPIVDSGVADHLNKTIQAARLKGARIIVTGISDDVAETIVDLGIDWGAVETLRDLQSGLQLALDLTENKRHQVAKR